MKRRHRVSALPSYPVPVRNSSIVSIEMRSNTNMQLCEVCPVPNGDTLFQHYHDTEWGMPVTCDRRIFEKVCLEGFQAGLSWQTILHRREQFRHAFAEFDINRVALFSEKEVDKLVLNEGIIRNRRKILSAINNANRAIELQREFGSLAAFFWSFEPATKNRPSHISLDWLKDNPSSSESVELSKELKKRGWSFVGPTTMYALMQALGLVNDHVHSCPARVKIEQARNSLKRPKPP